jgi:hypothetical protein
MFSEKIKINLNCFNIVTTRLFLICIFFLPVIPVSAEEQKLEEYFSDIRPGPEDKPTEVKIGVAVIDINSIDGANQSFTANVFISMQWEDPRLAKATKASRTLGLDEVWNPSIQLVNQQKLFKTFRDVVEVSPEGNAFFRQRYWGTFAYPMNLKDFPLDHHSLEIKIVAAGYRSDDIKFVIDEGKTGLGEPLTVTDWKIEEWEAYPESIQIGPGLPSPVGVIFAFEVHRLKGFYVIKVLSPLIMIIFMSWIIFFIEPIHVGPKISVAITAMLTLIAYRFLLGNLLPKISYLTRLDYFLLGSTFLVFAALIETAVTAKLMALNREEVAREIDYWSRWTFAAAFIVILVASFIF